MPKVHYRHHKVGDENLRAVLDRVAAALDHNITITAGERSRTVNGTMVETSLRRKPAADFSLGGVPLRHAFDTMRRKKADIFDGDKRYQVILHGRYSETGRGQIHVERLIAGPSLVWFAEGETRRTAGRYKRIY